MSSEMEPCPRCALHEASPAPCCEDAAAETAQAEAETMHACCCRHKKRSEEEYKSLIHRLNRIEGQIRGIRGMVEKDVYCADILVQVAAANSALNAFSRELLSQHVRTCVADDLRAGSDEKLDELLKLLPKLMK
ncbi:metal-sensing transcriptional repressor [Faecalibacterium prausnitzii]|uniref:metal-sensing transcriptional repressor n=1 Tax=Faecalibacterium prausnitzii TaxID=853 RepID=UPI00349F46D9